LDSKEDHPHPEGVLEAIAIILVGAGSGVLSGMFGVGGAVLTTPGLRAFGATPLESVGSTIPAILPGALTGAWRYHREGLVDHKIALTTGSLGAVSAVAGATLSDHVNGHLLMLLTAAMLLWGGLRSIRPERHQVEELVLAGAPSPLPPDVLVPSPPPTAVTAAVGIAAGLVAGLLGVGGGVLLVPAFTALLKLAPKQAVGTSLVAVAMLSVPAMATHAWLGHINWTYALLLVVGVIPGARLGAHLTVRGSEARLRLLMGLFFTLLALSYGASELLAV
jgi:uncharacterized membrane protein YfcA